MKNLTNKLLSSFLAITIVATAFGFLTVKTTPKETYAQVVTNSTSLLNDNDDDDETKTLYYFSDNTHCTTFRQNLLDDEVVDFCYLYDWSDTDFKEALRNYFMSFNYFDINNAYIVFELSKGFTRETQSLGNYLLPDYLEMLFYAWKNNGCVIMFINGTNESRLGDKKAFLDYVDLHFNISVFETFILNIFSEITEVGYTDCLDNCTIILDYTLSNGITTNDYHLAWFFYEWLIPLVREAYRTEVNAGLTSREIYALHNTNIICYLGNNDFYDVKNYTTINYDDPNSRELFYTYLNNEYVYAIGANLDNQLQLTQAWFDLMLELRNFADNNFPIYLCYTDGLSIPDSSSNLFTAPEPLDSYDAIVDFLSDNTPTGYAHVNGYCETTYFSLSGSSNGWMDYIPISDEIDEDGNSMMDPWEIFQPDYSGSSSGNDYHHNYSSSW